MEFPWKKDTWYVMKLEVQNLDKGPRGRARQGVAEGRAGTRRVNDRAH